MAIYRLLIQCNSGFQDLLDGLIEQQKALISKIEKGKGTMKQDEKMKVMNLLKELSNSIDKTKEDIKNMISISGLKKRSKAEVINILEPLTFRLIFHFPRFRKIY